LRSCRWLFWFLLATRRRRRRPSRRLLRRLRRAAPTTAAAPPSAEEEALAKKKVLLEYGVMEDKYLNDARGQWATEAKASSVFGDDNGRTPSESNMPARATGPADGHQWNNNNIDKGFDWLELGYATPVNATEVRVVIGSGKGVEAISKVELQDTDGSWHTVWEGISDVKRDQRGSRTWFVRSFDKTRTRPRAPSSPLPTICSTSTKWLMRCSWSGTNSRAIIAA
jgi:hypothetical protein